MRLNLKKKYIKKDSFYEPNTYDKASIYRKNYSNVSLYSLFIKKNKNKKACSKKKKKKNGVTTNEKK